MTVFKGWRLLGEILGFLGSIARGDLEISKLKQRVVK